MGTQLFDALVPTLKIDGEAVFKDRGASEGLQHATGLGEAVRYARRLAGAKSHDVKAAGVDRVTNTNSETAFALAKTLEASDMLAGRWFEFRYGVVVAKGNAANTVALKVKLGGTVLAQMSAFDPTDTGGDVVLLTGRYYFDAAGSSGLLTGKGVAYKNVNGTISEENLPLVGKSVDLSAQLKLTCTATWSAADANNQVDARHLSFAFGDVA